MVSGKIYRASKKTPATIATKKYVNQRIKANQEHKYKADTLTTLSSINNAWIEVDLTNIAQGDSATSRDGADIILESIEINAVVANGDDNNVVRMIIAIWDNTTQVPLADGGGNIDSVLTLANVNGYTAGMSKKLYDQYILLDVPFTGATVQKPIKYYYRFKNGLKIHYTTGASTGSKKIILSMISDSIAVANPGITHGFAKVVFTDS